MKTALKSLLVLCLTFTLFVNVVSAQQENNKVDPKIAYNTAFTFLVGEQVTPFTDLNYYSNMYDIDDTILGYYFDIRNNNETVGYIVVSATTERTPILQFGLGAIDDNYKINVQKERAYYLNAMNLMYAQNAADLKTKHKNLISKKLMAIENKIKNSTNEDEKQMLNKALQEVKDNKLESLTKGEYTESWNKLNAGKKDSSKEVKILSTTYKELSVTRLWQRTAGVTYEDSACGPTTGAMIANYLKSTGYNVRNSSYYGGNAEFINHLWGEMAWWWGTSSSAFRGEMKEHLNKDYSSTKFSAIVWDSGSYYNNLKGEINSGLPFGIRFDSNSAANVYSSYHWVAGIGYWTTSVDEFIGIKDPDSGEFNTSTHWISWETNISYTETTNFSLY